MSTMDTMRLGLVAALALTGCAPDLEPSLDDEAGTTAEPTPGESESESESETAGESESEGGGPQVQIEDEGDGVTLGTIDATSEDRWIYLDLEGRTQPEPADPSRSDAWDLGLRRSVITINGGISGSGGMEAAVLPEVAFDAVTAVPSEGWVTDAADGDDDDEDPDHALGSWYDYDFMTHVLSPRPVVYVVRTVEGNAFKLEVLGYYDEAGTSAIYTIRWAPLPE